MLKKTDKPSSIKKYRVITIANISSITMGIIIILIGMIYYKYRISELGVSDTTDYQEYDYHFAIISEEADETFWDAIYQGALEKGKEKRAYVEKIGNDLSITYSVQDLMRIAIASKVDGIILQPNGDDGVTELINEAEDSGIPVVTVLRDDPGSERSSYVGINTYSLEQVYANEVLDIIKDGKKNITVLVNEDTQRYVYSSILSAVSGLDVAVESVSVDSKSTFSTEEVIRNIIKDQENPPDVLVCLTALDTICAYQAVVDYNKVGEIDIVGYYDSEKIKRAIKLNIIHSTMRIDANQLGEKCVEALTEYLETNNVSDFYSVGIEVINKDNIDDFMVEETKVDEVED